MPFCTMANRRETPWKKSWAGRRSASSGPEPLARACSTGPTTFSPNFNSYLCINIVICALEFAPQKGIAVDPTTHSALVFGVVPRHLQLTPPMLETSSVFSTTSELFARFCSARPLFSTICGLFCQNQGAGYPRPGFFSPRMPVSPNAGLSAYVRRITFP